MGLTGNVKSYAAKKRFAYGGKACLSSPELHQTFNISQDMTENHTLPKAIAGFHAYSLARVKIFCFSGRYREKQKFTMCQQLKYV